MADSITVKKLNAHLKNSKGLTLLDVRRKADYQDSPRKISGAVWHDPEEIDTWISQVPADGLTVAYCVKGGMVSQSVADRLQKAGVEALFLEGGIRAWIEEGRPTEEI